MRCPNVARYRYAFWPLCAEHTEYCTRGDMLKDKDCERLPRKRKVAVRAPKERSVVITEPDMAAAMAIRDSWGQKAGIDSFKYVAAIAQAIARAREEGRQSTESGT